MQKVTKVSMAMDGGGIVGLEAKSGKYPQRHAALGNVLESDDYDVRRGVVFSRLNIEQDGKVLYLPWYALAFLREAIDPEIEFPRAVLPAL